MSKASEWLTHQRERPAIAFERIGLTVSLGGNGEVEFRFVGPAYWINMNEDEAFRLAKWIQDTFQ